ncbi:hypothetical protein B7494_g6880 [Chlorociboria aeruginascens]|nr:hypothetical protein B7494_g6880 [Chlorociboria aeruginascens]
MDSFQALPRDTPLIRDILFKLPLPFSLNIANYKLFWPLIDNVYSIRRSRHSTLSCDYNYHYVICRFKQARDPTSIPSSSQRASTTKRSIQSCDVSFVIHEFENHVEFYHVTGQSNCQHTHSLDESDANKRNSLIRTTIQQDIAKGYAPAAVIGAIRGNSRIDIRMRLNSIGGLYLTRQDAINSGASWRTANPNALFTSHDSKNVIKIQVKEAFEKLDSLKWISLPIQARSLDGTIGHGIVFAQPERLGQLTRYGHLTLMDSTHKTNQLEWKLFTLMARNNHACWIPLAHGLLSNEFGELIAEFLLVLKKWVTWHARHVITDDSAAEIKAFRLAFPGLIAGEIKISHLLCRVHCQRTIKRKLGTKADSRSRAALMSALCNRQTKLGALESTNQAIALAANSQSADYIRNNWLSEIEKWANYAREHSALLLQVTTTNPVEAWHRSLKSLAKISKLTIRPKYSLAGIITIIAQCAESYDARAQKAAYDWSKKKLSAISEYPWLNEFPYHVQLLLLDEIKAATLLAESGKDPMLSSNGTCSCKFARSYWLPCRHVILAYEFLFLIEEPNWEEYAHQFDESGFEIYSTRVLVEVEDESHGLSQLTDAMTGSQFLTITGLLGTYEDCVSWLARPESLNDLTSITFLWMGNSIANFSHYSQASTFLFRFKKACQQSNIRSQFILSTDICQDRARIYEAYNTKGIFGEFLLNVLTHANAVMDKSIFCMRDWSCEVEFNAGEHNLHVYVAPRSDLQICIGEGQTISLSKGERVQIATSGKWTEKVMQELCTDAGLVIHQKWKDQGGSYCVYCHQAAKDLSIPLEPQSTRSEHQLNLRELPNQSPRAETIQEPPNDVGEPLPALKVILLTIALCLAALCMSLDSTILATAIPRITSQFNSLDDVGWYGSSYMFATCATQMIYGKFYTFYPTKWVFLAGVFFFELGSLISGVAPTSATLIGGRAMAGLGAGGIFSGALIIVATNIPLRQRPIYVALISSMNGVASVAGPLLGGVFTDHLTWRWCFYINLPLGGITILFILIFLPSTKPPSPNYLGVKERLKAFDLIGSLFLIPGIICLLLALQWGGSKYPWDNGRIIALFVIFAVLITLFLLDQIWQKDQATIPIRFMKNRNLLGAILYSVNIGGARFVFAYYLPIWFQAIKGVSATKSGIMILPSIVGLVIFALIGASLVTVIGYYTPFLILSSAIAAVGAGLLSTLMVNSGIGEWFGYQVLMAFGAGLGVQNVMLVPQVALPAVDLAMATSVLTFSQTLCGAIFLPIGQSVFQNQLVHNLQSYAPSVNTSSAIHSGVTQLRQHFSADDLALVLQAYNVALVQTFYVGVATSALSFMGPVFMQWLSIKGHKANKKSWEVQEPLSNSEVLGPENKK